MLYLACLYLLLGSPRYPVREAAETALIEHVRTHPAAVGPRLEALSRTCTNPEIAARVRKPLGVYRHWLAARYVPAGVPVWPICDCYPEEITLGEFHRCRRTVPKWMTPEPNAALEAGPYWHSYRRATEFHARGLIRDGVPATEVDALLVRMYALEVAATHDVTGPVMPWKEWRGGYPLPPVEPEESRVITGKREATITEWQDAGPRKVSVQRLAWLLESDGLTAEVSRDVWEAARVGERVSLQWR